MIPRDTAVRRLYRRTVVSDVHRQPLILLWSLRTKDDHQRECRARRVATGIQVEIVSDGVTLFNQTFATSEEALAWAEEKRKEWTD
jgi:hypothetical protein